MRRPKKGPSAAAVMYGFTTDLLVKFAEVPVQEWVEQANSEMWNWEECSFRAHKVGLTPDDAWRCVKFSRNTGVRQLIPLHDTKGRPFQFQIPPSVQRLLHFIDIHLGGSVQAAWPELTSEDDQRRYLISSLCEEAIASSELEGAVVTRKEAKEMLMKKKKPQNAHERMVMNNYRTIQMLNQRRDEPLTADLLMETQRQLTQGTLEDEACGRLRREDEKITVWDDEDHQILHEPPLASELPDRVKQLCAFANTDGQKDGKFIHPVIRAVLLHFWLAYDHPFVDGNGRTARALFYWSMLRHRYWLIEYLTISSIILKQPKQYPTAFLNTEQDDNDLTYFLLYHVEVIERSIAAFHEYLSGKIAEKRRLTRVLLPALFNDRQRAILIAAQKDPDTFFTYESHATAHQVTLATARTDLLGLEKKGLLVGNRVGRRFHFVAPPNLVDRLRKISKK
ncbi:MAG: Fic family protein [Planctomycetes bacterium]|nr:Fic family protein [Planctomycetota bacterium]